MIYWGCVPVNSYWNGGTRDLLDDMLIDIRFVLQFHDNDMFKGVRLT